MIKKFFSIALVIICISCNDSKIRDKVIQANSGYKKDLNKLFEIFKRDDIVESKKIDSVPRFIIDFLKGIRNEDLIISNYGEPWNASDNIIDKINDTNLSKQGKEVLLFLSDSQKLVKDSTGYILRMPNKKLSSFGMGKEIVFISFRNGGFTESEDFYVMRYENDSILDYWHGVPQVPVETTSQAIAYIEKVIDNIPF